MPRIAAVDRREKPSLMSVVRVPTASAVPPATRTGDAPERIAGSPKRTMRIVAASSAIRARAPREPATTITSAAKATPSSTSAPPRERSATAYVTPPASSGSSTRRTSSPARKGMEPAIASPCSTSALARSPAAAPSKIWTSTLPESPPTEPVGVVSSVARTSVDAPGFVGRDHGLGSSTRSARSTLAARSGAPLRSRLRGELEVDRGFAIPSMVAASYGTFTKHP